MAQTETVEIKGKRFTASTLTVRQVRDVLQSVEGEDYRPGLIDRLFADGLPEPAFLASLDIKLDQLDELSPEEVKELMEAVAKVNPTYAGMEKRVSANGVDLEKLQSRLKELASISSL